MLKLWVYSVLHRLPLINLQTKGAAFVPAHRGEILKKGRYFGLAYVLKCRFYSVLMEEYYE